MPWVPGARRAAEAEADQASEPRERAAACAAVAPDHKTRAEDDGALRRAGPGVERLFPRSADERGEAVAERGILGAHEIGRVAVDVGRAHLHPDGRRRIDARHGQPEHARGFHAGTKDLVLMIGRLDAIDAAADEVDEAGRRPVPAATRRACGHPRACASTGRGPWADRETRYDVIAPEAARCVASETPRKPLPPAMTIERVGVVSVIHHSDRTGERPC